MAESAVTRGYPDSHPVEKLPGRKGGSATIPSGQASIVVAHGLPATPTVVHATGRHAETKDAHVTAADATNITIAVGANVTANRTVYWTAELGL